MVRHLIPFALLVFSSVAGAQQYVISTIAGGAAPPTPAVALQTSIGDPPRIATDAAGNIYFGGLHSVFKVDSTGTIIRIAGNGQTGYSGDGGAATAAQLNYPAGIAVDSGGTVYVADRSANVVRAISPSLAITTVAGTGAAGFQGDGGSATQAQLNAPIGIAVDAKGNLYIADSGNSVIRKVSGGVITTVAGNGAAGFSGDSGPATSASLYSPEGVAVDKAGFIYIADTFNNRVRSVTGDGTIQTIAGTGKPDFSDETVPVNSPLFFPSDVSLDPNGTLYIADLGNSRIRQIANGKIVTLAGGDGGLEPFPDAVATAVHLNGPTGIAIDGQANLYFAEGSLSSGTGRGIGDYRIWKVNAAGTLSVAAGTGVESFSGDGGAAAVAQLNTPSNLALDAVGNLYFSDTANNRVRQISPSGAITTVAGTGTAGFGGDSGAATLAGLDGPTGLAVDGDGNLYIADTGNNRIRKVLPNGTILSIAGNGNGAYFGDGGIAQNAAIHAPQGVAIDKAGNLYIADTGNQRIRKALQNGTMTTLAGTGAAGSSGDGGPALSARLNQPANLALDGAGNLFVADAGNGSVRKIATDGTISTLASGFGAGKGAAGGTPPGPAAVAVDGSGNVYVTDSPHNQVRVITPNGTVATIAGNGVCCYSGDGGPAANAKLNTPWGLAVDSAGRIFIGDSGNGAIRLIQPSGNQIPAISYLANGASNLSGPIAPGEIITLVGTNLGPLQLTTPAPSTTGPPQVLAGVSVTFNGTAASLVYVSAGQVSAIVPPGLSGSSVQVVVQYLGLASAPLTVPSVPAAPAIFTANSSGTGPAVAFNEDGTVNTGANPAKEGSVVTLLLNGATSQFLAGALSATVEGIKAAIVDRSSFPVPAGIVPIGVRVPTDIAGGPLINVTVSIGTYLSQAGVTISITVN